MKTTAYRQATATMTFLLLSVNVIAQPIPGEIPTPTVASLARFGDVPVSLFTGSPRISIPVHSLHSGTQSPDMSISLDYDASGILMNTLPSWTGYNWTLNVGGVISRQMYGFYDDFLYPAQAHASNSRRWFDNYGKLEELMSASDRESAFNNWNILYDDGPDIFTFSFMGHSGKFYLGNDGQWKVQSDENLDVQFDITDNSNYQNTPFMYPQPGTIDIEPKTIRGFTIRDAEGYTYTFGYHPDAIEYTHSFFDMAHNEDVYAWHASAWHLTSVRDKYGNSLFSLTYARGPYVIQAYNAFSMLNWHAYTEFGIFPSVGLNTFSYHFDDTFPYGFSISSPSYLSKVSSRTGVEVTFVTSASPKSSYALYPSLYQSTDPLDPYGINRLYQNLAERVTRWALEHPTLGAGDPTFYSEGAFHFLQDDSFSAYRYNSNSNPMDILGYARLKQLNCIEVRNCHSPDQEIKFYLEYEQSPRMHLTKVSVKSYRSHQQVQEYAYRLLYNSFGPLPSDCLTRATDHWGFYNGRFQYPYPQSASDCYAYYAQKEPDTTYCRNGMLREIVYPTGGATTIEYEPNSYSLYQSEARNGTVQLSHNQVCGGVRVKSLTDWDGPGRQAPARKRIFKYNIPGTSLSSGQLFSKPRYYWENWTVVTEPGTNSYDEISIFRTSSIIPLSNSFGPHVGYSYAEERDSSDNSSTTYHYSNLSDGLADQRFDFSYLDNGSSTPLDMFTEKGFWRGKLLQKCEYDNIGRKVRGTGYTYDTIDESFYTYRCNLSLFTPNGSASNYFRMGGVTRLLSPKVLLSTVRDSVFAGGCSVTVRTTTYQNFHLTMSHPYQHYAEVRLAKTEQVSRGGSSERRIFDYPSSNTGSASSHRISSYFCLSPISETIHRNGEFVEKQQTSFRTLTWPVQYQAPIHEYVPDVYTITYRDGTSENIVTYDSYEKGGRLVKYTRKGELPTSITWGYHGSYPVLVGKSDGPLVSPFILVDGADNHLDSIRSAISHSTAPVWGYVFNPLYGLTEQVSPNGHVTHYRYDQMGRLSDIYDDGMRRTHHYEYNYSIRY